MSVDKVEDPKGDRVKIEMCGKFLAYKTGEHEAGTRDGKQGGLRASQPA